VGGFNGLLADAAAAIASLASPVALPAAGLVGLATVGGSIRREHERRRVELKAREGAEVSITEDGTRLPAMPISDCSTPAAAMEAVRRALAIERINVRPLTATPTPWGWEIVVQMRQGKPGDITRVGADLETLLDVREAGVLITPDRERRARVTLRVVESDPWADMPSVPDYSGAGRSVRDAVWLGQRLDGAQISTAFASKHSLILAASGGGKSILLRAIADGLGAAGDTHIWDLDPSGVGQAPQAAVMGRVALDPEACEQALTDAVAIAVARTRLLRKLGMGDSWQSTPERPALAVIVDEYPRLTPAARDAAVALLRIGRKAAVFLLFASQDAKKDTLGDSIAGQVAFRAAGPGLQDWQADLLFGAGARARGWDPGRYQPATSADSPNDAGTFYLAGAGEDMALPMKVGYMSGATAQTRAEQYAAGGLCPQLDAETLAAAGLDEASVYVRSDEVDATPALVEATDEPITDEALALLESIAADVQAWGTEWIPAAEIAAMAARRMGWEQGKATEMRTAALLDQANIPSRRRSTGIVRPRAALLTAADRELLPTA
jgi:S-DNA-T family DNA segregation ATPase FtsK/SpoIIIE